MTIDGLQGLIKKQELKEKSKKKKKLTITPLQVTFPKHAQVIRSNDEVIKITDLYINTLENENKG
jgi:hypothetical protein